MSQAALSTAPGVAAPANWAAETARPRLRALALRGAAWTLAGYGLSQVLRLGGNLVLARLLFPDAFGLMALVFMVLQGLQMFSDVGIAPSIVQNRRGEDAAFLKTAWTIQAVRGLVLCLACAALAPLVAQFYGQPALNLLLSIAGLTALLAGFESTAIPLANRRMAVRSLTVLELGAQILSLAVMVIWAWQAPSVWPLLGGALVYSAVRLTGSFFVLPNVPVGLRWDRTAARELFHFGRWVFVSTLLTFLVTQGDRMLFGKLLSLSELGVYSIAAMLALLPKQIVTRIEGAVLFPTYSAVVQQGRELGPTFTRVRRPVAVGMGLITAILLAAGPHLVAVLYDPRYQDAGWMLQLIAAGVVLQALESINGAALLAAGNARAVAAGSAVKLAGMIALVPIGWHFGGMVGALVGFLLAEFGKYLVSAGLVRRLGLRVLSRDLPLIVAVLATGGFGWAVARVCSARWPLGEPALVMVATLGAALWWIPQVGVVVRELRHASPRDPAPVNS